MVQWLVQWPRLHALDAGESGSIPGEGTRSHMPQLKIQHSHTNKYLFEKKKKKEEWPLLLHLFNTVLEAAARELDKKKKERKKRKEGGKKKKKGKEKATRLERKAVLLVDSMLWWATRWLKS